MVNKTDFNLLVEEMLDALFPDQFTRCIEQTSISYDAGFISDDEYVLLNRLAKRIDIKTYEKYYYNKSRSETKQ